jgi:hypothetical protein
MGIGCNQWQSNPNPQAPHPRGRGAIFLCNYFNEWNTMCAKNVASRFRPFLDEMRGAHAKEPEAY